MGIQQVRKGEFRGGVSCMERLSLRVSEMINHPISQLRRWVTIYRLDSDGDREWGEVLGMITETDELDLTLNDDGSVTVRWERQEAEGLDRGDPEFYPEEEPTPF
jgi:hypothetical protein